MSATTPTSRSSAPDRPGSPPSAPEPALGAASEVVVLQRTTAFGS
ncbi:hypothetical protein [Streptomyces sp. cg40]